MYRFYQSKEGKCEWQMVPDDKDNLAQLATSKTPLITILAVSEDPDTAEDLDKLKYRGSFYIDIDRSGDTGGIKEAIVDTKRLVKVLKGHGVEQMELYCSGSKGFHIIIPSKVFSPNRPMVYLNLIYKEMALCLAGESNAEGIDMVVYSGGKGRMLRQANVKRKNGCFKVPITEEELSTMSADDYQELIKKPREVVVPKQDGKAVGLSTLFTASQDKVKRYVKHARNMIGMEKEDLQELDFGTGCIQRLYEIGDEKPEANFNRAAMVMASFIKDKGYSKDQYEPILKQMATNVKSGTYRKVGVRFKHLIGQVHTALSNKRIKFAPQYLYSVIHPCKSCALCKPQVQALEEEDTAEVDASGIRVSEKRYLKGREEEARIITNFTMRIERIYMAFDPDLRRFMREKVDVTLVHAAGETPMTLEDECFISKNALSKAIVGVSNLVVKGNDADVISIKEHVFSRTGEAEVIYSAEKYGMMEATNESNGAKFLVYVEPHFSISMTGAINQYKVPEGQDNFPKLHRAEQIPSGDFMLQTLKYLFSINSKATLAQIIGWNVACFYKIHFGKRFGKQFPMLHVFGNAGSGKTATVELVSYLHGLDFFGQDSMVNLGSGTTPYAVRNSIASSTTVPRVFDEFNAGKLRYYDTFVEILKACWTSQAHTQGGISNNRRGGGSSAKLHQITLTGPVCTLGEQRFDMPALNERAVQVHLRLSDRGVQDSNYSSDTAYTNLNSRKEFLISVGRIIMSSALKTSATKVEDFVKANEKFVPEGLPDRPAYSRKVILTGLDLMIDALKSVDIDATSIVMEAKQAWIDEMLDSSVEDIANITRTEVDKVMSFLTSMVATDDMPDKMAIRKEYEFYVSKGSLFIDFNRTMIIYRRASLAAGLKPVYQNFAHMQKQLQEEDYFVGYREGNSPSGQQVKYTQLDMSKLIERGIEAEYFYDTDDDVVKVTS